MGFAYPFALWMERRAGLTYLASFGRLAPGSLHDWRILLYSLRFLSNMAL